MSFLVQRCDNGRGFLFSLIMGAALLFSGNISGLAQTLDEGLDTTNLVWTTGGNTFWFVQTTNTHDGVDAVRHGNVASNETSWLETTIMGPATVRFWTLHVWESWPRAYVGFSINGSSGAGVPGHPGMTWYESILDLGVGTNVLRWTAYNHYGATNSDFRALDQVLVSPPRPLEILWQPMGDEVYSGESPGMSVSAIGTPPLYYQWRREGMNIGGATNSWFYLDPATTNDVGNYSVIVSNSQGFVVSSNALLTVLPPSLPFFIYEPVSITAYSGESIYFGVGVDGSPPFTFQWRKDGTNIPGTMTSSGSGGYWSPSLTLTNISDNDAGNYTLVVTNDYGSVESSNAVLTVIPSAAPVILRHPRSLEVAQGVSTWMSVMATGDPAPAYQWAKIGDPPPPPPPEPPFPFPQPGQPTQPKRWFTNVISADAGIYFATATNLAGETRSRETLLTVLPPISNLGSWWQGAENIYVTNGLAFLAQGASGFAILSVSNPVTPVLLGGYNTPGFASAVQVVGGRAYVADGSAGLQIFSISNPYSPVLLGNYNTPHSATDVSVRSNLAYVADGNSGLLIINVSNPASPSLAGNYKTNFSAGHVRVAGDYAFVSSQYSEALPGTNIAGFFVINVTDIAHPIEVGRLSFGIGNFDVRGQTVFGVNGSSLKVIAVTNPAQPVITGSFDTYRRVLSGPILPPHPPSAISASDVRVVNDIAYVGGYLGDESRLYAVDVRDLTEPIPVGYYTNSGQRYVLWAESNLVYFAGTGSSLEIIQSPFDPAPVLPPHLTLNVLSGMQLGVHGRRGFRYDLESSAASLGLPWQTLQTILLTNDTATFPITPTPSNAFFRLKQLD